MKRDDDLDFEISLYEDLVAAKPNFVDALIPLAEAYTRKGMYVKGLETDQRIVRLRQDDPVARYNLACDYALLKDPDHAFEALGQAIMLGYDDFDHLEQDPDLDSLRADPRYAALLVKYGKR